MRVMIDVPGGKDELVPLPAPPSRACQLFRAYQPPFPVRRSPQLGVMSKQEALSEARSRELDLVLVAKGSGESNPSIVKIVSYDKFRFAKEKKAKDQKKASKGQVQCNSCTLCRWTCWVPSPPHPLATSVEAVRI